MRVPVVLAVLAGLLAALPGEAAGLYESSVIVTGMDARSRPTGLLQALGLVLAKASGNPALAMDPRIAGIEPTALLRGLVYLDRMSDQPKRDEQGTRDRPYDLVARFDPARIDSLLRDWNEAPWPEPRPVVVAEIRIQPRQGGPLALRADTDPDERHRAALLAAADRVGLEVVLPASLPPAPPMPGTDAPRLHGELHWDDAAPGWQSVWLLAWMGREDRWTLRGTSFDAAYRAGTEGAARILSGRTPPARP